MHDRYRILIFTLLSAPLLLAAPGSVTPQDTDTCKDIAGLSARASCYQKRYESADRELNAVYKKLKASLDDGLTKEMRDDSRNWIRYKEYQCGFQAEMTHNYSPPKTENSTENAAQRKQRLEYEASYYDCLHDYTVSRSEYLRRAFGGEGVSPGISGTYADSFGGTLHLEKDEKTERRLLFKLEVVRGPTHHIGEIGGVIDVPAGGQKAVYAERSECAGDVRPAGDSESPCCRIEFAFASRRPTVSVKATGCEYYRGARAYFDGDFRKIR